VIRRNPLGVIGKAAAIGAFVMLAGAAWVTWEPAFLALYSLLGAAAGAVLGTLNVLLTRE
jgi:hypothetical protein